MRRLQKARKAASELLARHHIRQAPVDVKSLAKEYATIVERPLDNEISGVLVPMSDEKWAILVNSSHSRVRQRFTIGHELGHLILHSYTTAHADRAFRFRDAQSSQGSALEEIQANQFAAELLMPRDLILQSARDFPFEHAPDTEETDEEFEQYVGQMSQQFDVSRQAMAIRIASVLS